MEPGYPKLIADYWVGAPEKIDAAHSNHLTGSTFFISGQSLYLLDDKYVRFWSQDLGMHM